MLVVPSVDVIILRAHVVAGVIIDLVILLR
jgi:hypothetical protein